MAVGTALAIAGLVSGAVGSKKQADAQKKATQAATQAAQYNPYDVNGPFGNVSFDPTNQSVSSSMSPEMQQFRSLFGDQALQYLNGNSPTSGFQNYANQVGGGQLPQLFGQAIDTAGNIPISAYNQYQNTMGNLGQQAQGLFDLSGLTNSRLEMLRQQAAPYEQRQMDMVANSAFARGQLGGPGGRLALSNFGDSLARADLGRQMAAQDLGVQAQGVGGNLIGLQGNLAQGMFGNAITMSNLANTRAQQRLQNATGLFGFGQELSQQDYNQGQGYFGNMQGMDEQMRQWIALGGNIGGQQSQAGANQGQFMMQNSGSPGGAFLSTLGTGLFNQYMNNMPVGRSNPNPPLFNPTPTLNNNWWEGPQ